MVITGVDWSGDGGVSKEKAPDRDLLVIAFASIDADHREHLRAALTLLRECHGFRPDTVFKHADSSDRVRADFFEQISHTGIEVRVRLVDKTRDWPPAFSKLTSNQRITSCLAASAADLPDRIIAGGVLLLDLDQKRDGKLCSSTAGAINRSTRTGGRAGFRKVKCCPDTDRELGEIIQVADMVAGALRRAGGAEPPKYRNWNRIVVEWQPKAPR